MPITFNWFSDSPEYTARCVRWSKISPILEVDHNSRLRTPFSPPRASLKEIHDVVPRHLLRKKPLLSTAYILRDITLCVALGCYAWHIPWISQVLSEKYLHQAVEPVFRTVLWVNYWWWQGLIFTGFFCIGGNVVFRLEDIN